MLKKTFNIITIICYISIVLFWISFLFLELYPFKPITYNNLPHKVLSKTLIGGQKVPILVNVCTTTNKSFKMTASLKNIKTTVTVSLGSVERNILKGCQEFTSEVWTLPLNLEAGTYEIIFLTSYTYQLGREINIPNWTEPFQVVK